MDKRTYWQLVRGICILAVVLIHSLSGFEYVTASYTDVAFIVLRQVINFAVAVFIFMSGYFVNTKYITSEDFNYKRWLKKRGGAY